MRLDHIGDFLLWAPTAKYYRESFPDHHITLIGNKKWSDLSSFLPFWDDFIAVEGSDLYQTDINNWYFDIVLNTQYSRTRESDYLIKSLKAKQKIAALSAGPNYARDQFEHSNKIYSSLFSVDNSFKHELQRNFEILNSFTGKKWEATFEGISCIKLPMPCLNVDSDRYIVIFPGASWKKRCYPWPRFVRLIFAIEKKYPQIGVVLCGSKEDAIIANNIVTNTKKNIFNLCGELNLLQTLSIIGKSELVVSNDSMGAHAAVILNKKVICLMGGGYTSKSTEIGRFFPYPAQLVADRENQTILNYFLDCYGCSNICRYGEIVRDSLPCIEYIPENDLIQAVEVNLDLR